MGGAILIIVGHLRGLFTASCTEGSFAEHSSLYCGLSRVKYTSLRVSRGWRSLNVLYYLLVTVFLT